MHIIEDKNNADIMMDLNIPFKVYFFLFVIIVLIIILKYFFSNEDIFDFIEQYKKNSLKIFSDEKDKLNLLTKLNTKINRDFLDNSKYYNGVGYTKIYGFKKENTIISKNESHKNNNLLIENKNKVCSRKNKKVCFSNNIIYENENQ